MRALITGAAGFVGRHMVAALQRRPGVRQIVSVDLKPMTVDMDWAKPPHIHLIGDALDIFRKEDDRYDLTVHCAYHVGGRAAIDGVNMNLARNLELDAALFEWAVRTRQPRVLYFSSSAAYPRDYQTEETTRLVRETEPSPVAGQTWQEAMRLREYNILLEEPAPPDADYGWAKLTGERLAARARANGVNVHVVRPFSGYGEDQNPDEYPFPAIVSRAREGDLTVWGPEGQTRDWIHIDDVVAGALAVVDAGYQEPVNLCTGIGTEMGDLARMIWDQVQDARADVRAANGGMSHRDCADCRPIYDESKPSGVFYRVGDPTLMHQFYTPKITLAEGIRRALNVPS